MIISGVLGILIASLYITIRPSQYFATLQIGLGKNSKILEGSYGPLYLIDYSRLIDEIQIPSTYTEVELNACDMQNQKELNNNFINLVKIRNINPGLVEISAHGESPSSLENCLEAIVALLQSKQKSKLLPVIEEAKLQLSSNQITIERLKSYLNKKSSQNDFLLATLELKSIEKETSYLRAFINNSDVGWGILSPLVTLEKQNNLNKMITLIIGLFSGFLLGMIVDFLFLTKSKIQK